jgi:cytochrome c-type biogenesis protein CcmH
MGIGAFAVLLLAFALTGIAAAQGDPKKVSDDEVNAVARKLYCPVCENIPLDVCGTTACAQWREEIRLQLAEGATDQQVIDDFVKRFGDRVVGTPQDPTLRALSLAIPLGISALSLIGHPRLHELARRTGAWQEGAICPSPCRPCHRR